MKQFLIGDGHKRISCPDAYLADTEGTETTVIWHPEHHEIPMWNSIAKPGNAVASPAWHGEVLAARRAKVEAGAGQFSPRENCARLKRSA